MPNQSKIRILFLYDFPLWGSGSATFMRHLISELLRNGYSVAICAPERRKFHRKVKQYFVKLKKIPVFVGHPELRGAKKYAEISDHELTNIYHSHVRAALKAIKDFRPHLIHVNHLSLISWVACYLKSLARIKYIITCHGSDLDNISRDKRNYLLTLNALRGASQITTVSGDTRAWFLQIFGKEFSKKTRTIPGGIDIKMFPEKMKIKVIPKKYRLGEKPLVLFVGRLIPQKGVRYLIKAAKKIKGEIFIVGSGPEMPALQKLVCEQKIKNVHFTGYMSQRHTKILKEFYYQADVFVAPSIWQEPLGLVILEAMACKTPVVVTRKGGIPLAVKERVNGYFVRPHNANDIAEKVNKILENKKLAKRLGENARKIVKRKFTWKKIAKRFEYIYQKHIGNLK